MLEAGVIVPLHPRRSAPIGASVHVSVSQVAWMAAAREASALLVIPGRSMASLLDLSRRLLALSQTGLHFTQEEYDRERYREMAQIAGELLALESNMTPDQLRAAWLVE